MNTLTNQLITIIPNDILTNVVNSKELHEKLGIKKDYTDWMKQQIKRAYLIENKDYVIFLSKGENPLGGRPSTEYHVTLEAAKNIAMLSGTLKGQEVRNYFLECERKLLNPKQVIPKLTKIQMYRLMLEAEEEIERLKPFEEIVNTSDVFFPTKQIVNKAKISKVSINKLYPFVQAKMVGLIMSYYSKEISKAGSVMSYLEDEVDDVMTSFMNDCEKLPSKTLKTLVLAHPCLINQTIQVKFSDVVKFFPIYVKNFTK